MKQVLSPDTGPVTQTADATLDAEELLHLALAASRRDKREEAIAFLKRAVALSTNDARLHFLLGAEHAQIGLYERAIEEMHRALQLDPGLDIAHFQVGLLHLTCGRPQAAADAWTALDRLDPADPLYLFKTGLLHLSRDEFSDCEARLREGIAANRSNQPLNQDMARMLAEVRSRLASNRRAMPSASPTLRPSV